LPDWHGAAGASLSLGAAGAAAGSDFGALQQQQVDVTGACSSASSSAARATGSKSTAMQHHIGGNASSRLHANTRDRTTRLSIEGIIACFPLPVNATP
jgi:hypothetical protein